MFQRAWLLRLRAQGAGECAPLRFLARQPKAQRAGQYARPDPLRRQRLVQGLGVRVWAGAKQRRAHRGQAVRLKAMPLGNVTQMTDAERALLARWAAGGFAR